MRKNHLFALGLATLLAVVAVTTAGGQASAPQAEYVVLYAEGASLTSARLAVEAAGGTIVSENAEVGIATVRTENPQFLAAVAAQAGALAGAAGNKAFGYAEPQDRAKPDDGEDASAAGRGSATAAPATAAAAKKKKGAAPIAVTPEPLAQLQWDMKMIHATADGSYARNQGDPGVLVGIIDTGVDGSHPDIAPNFDSALSRNFTTDIPAVDGPCEYAGCVDPANVDHNGHGTHVAGTIGAALNGLGMAGVAPKVTLVNIRAGQDSGYFFLQPTVDALTYAADTGIDVVNMSFYVDPWWMNCAASPSDSPAEQAEQRTIIAAMTRVLEYAHRHHVTLVSSAGNEHADLDTRTTDVLSPDYPPGSERTRVVDSTCRILPAMGPHVIATGSVGPTGIKADYSNYGNNWVDVSAPGGYFRDNFGTPAYRTNENQILAPYPQYLAVLNQQLNDDGSPKAGTNVVRDCQGGTCAYYQWIQGTSMAAPHTTGVAALIISEFGHRQGGRDGKGELEMNPERVEKILIRTATDHACPVPATVDYTVVGRAPDFNATCTGSLDDNAFYGEGIVDALAAVTFKDR